MSTLTKCCISTHQSVLGDKLFLKFVIIDFKLNRIQSQDKQLDAEKVIKNSYRDVVQSNILSAFKIGH